MKRKQARLLVACLVLLATGCSEQAGTERADVAPSPTPSVSQADTSHSASLEPSPSQDSSQLPTAQASNSLAVTTGSELLYMGGVRVIREGEPPHGDTDANLTGLWGGHLVIATVAPPGARLVPGRVLSREEVQGVEVLTMRLQGGRVVLRFPHEDHTVDLQVVTESLDYLAEDTAQLLVNLLDPSKRRS